MPSTKPSRGVRARAKPKRSARPAAAIAPSVRRRSKRVLDYNNFTTIRRMMSDKGKIRSRRITGTCRRHQNQLASAIKFSREMALLPYVNR